MPPLRNNHLEETYSIPDEPVSPLMMPKFEPTESDKAFQSS